MKSASKTSQLPVPRHQVAALPWRRDGKVEILLVSSRETGRWVLPKGWPMKGRTLHGSAAREALEEAGIEGVIGERPVGYYNYVKRKKNGSAQLCTVTVFPMHVTKQRKKWREMGQRTSKWWPAEEAAAIVHEPELRLLIKAFGDGGFALAPADERAA
jgi:ADP-ribose pyrophosphatase YjhB (NUDIX family)